MYYRQKLGILCATLMAFAPAANAQADSFPLPFAIDKESREISVVVDRGLRSMRGLPSRELRTARQAMFDGEPVEPDLLRRLADHGDTLAAFRYVDILMARGLEENASDVAYYSAIAVGGGRVWVLPEMVSALHLLDPNTEPKSRINKYIQILYPHAWAGNSLALDAVIDFNGEGRLFGPLSNATRDRIDTALEEKQDGRGDLKRATEILKDENLTDQDLAMAMTYLRRAEMANHLAVATTAANLIEQLTER